MAYSNELFSEQLDKVRDQFQDLSTTLEEVCENLKEPGSPPPPEILEIINSANKIFEELKSCVTEWAKSVQMPDIPDAQDLDSIKAITIFSKNIVAHQNGVQEKKVLEYINRALSIKYEKEDESFPLLENFHSDVNKLKSRVSTSLVSGKAEKDRTQILENRHPINDLLTLLERGNELNDESYNRTSEIISEKYGHDFMMAAVRGRFIISEIPDMEDPLPPLPDEQEIPKASEPEKTKDSPVDGQAEVQEEEIPEEPPTVTTQEEPDESEPESADDPSVDGQAEVQQGEIPEVTSEVTSEEEMEKSKPDELEQIEAEIALALERGSFGIAYHLARTTPGVLPSSQAVKFIASNYVTDKDSPVDSNLLSDLAEKMRDEILEVLNEKPDSLPHSYAAMLTSAALTPALTTHSEPIALLLESLDPHLAGLPSLRTLAQTVVKTSRSGIDIPVEQLHGSGSFEKWTQEAQALHKEGKDWIENERQLRMNFVAARDVRNKILDIWEKLLVKPSVKEIDIAAIASAAKHWKQNGEREIDNIDKENRGSRTSSNPIRSTVRTNLQSKINDVLAFADRWEKLGASPNEGQEFVDQLVNKLRDGIQEHGETALLEVARLKTPLARRAENLVQHYLDKFKAADSQVPDSRFAPTGYPEWRFACRSRVSCWIMQATPEISLSPNFYYASRSRTSPISR